MDPEGGNQPINNEALSMSIIANGEIYNFPKLHKSLAEKHNFKTKSDTETILHLYEDFGSDMVNKLEGMYAFAIADGENLFIARDPVGIKPLYYAENDDGFYFASELKPLAKLPGIIKEFPPGTYYHSKHGFNTYYTVPELEIKNEPVEVITSRLRQTLEKVVDSHLMSDVPLGVFLSGGLDSSITTALSRKIIGKPIHSFSVGIEGCPDLESARMLSSYLDTIHHEYLLSVDEVMAKLPEIIYYLESFDQDLVRSAIPTYFTARLAQEHVKVVLSGEGADELFAGYSYYKDYSGNDKILQSELRRSVSTLHNVNLQRVDRLTMAHSIEARVPFLDREAIEVGLSIPAKYKLYGNPPVEKWILRKAVEDLLPDRITWRNKEQFDEGSGIIDFIEQTIHEKFSYEDARKHRQKHPDVYLRSHEECFYHKLFTEVFERPEVISSNMGRWAERPDYQ
ncbi:MAG: asparagine synthase B [Bacillota bacterium]